MYTSGRTVKGNAKPTTVARATTDARRLIGKHLPTTEGVTVKTTLTADPVTLAPQLRTVITWPGSITPAHVQLGMAITLLPGYLSAINDDCSITYLRSA